MITAKQLLDWTDGRNAWYFQGVTWSGNTLSFRVSAAPAATTVGLTGMVPIQGPAGKTLQGLTRGGSAVTTTTRTIKGIAYGAMFDAQSGARSPPTAPDRPARCPAPGRSFTSGLQPWPSAP